MCCEGRSMMEGVGVEREVKRKSWIGSRSEGH